MGCADGGWELSSQCHSSSESLPPVLRKDLWEVPRPATTRESVLLLPPARGGPSIKIDRKTQGGGSLVSDYPRVPPATTTSEWGTGWGKLFLLLITIQFVSFLFFKFQLLILNRPISQAQNRHSCSPLLPQSPGPAGVWSISNFGIVPISFQHPMTKGVLKFKVPSTFIRTISCEQTYFFKYFDNTLTVRFLLTLFSQIALQYCHITPLHLVN